MTGGNLQVKHLADTFNPKRLAISKQYIILIHQLRRNTRLIKEKQLDNEQVIHHHHTLQRNIRLN